MAQLPVTAVISSLINIHPYHTGDSFMLTGLVVLAFLGGH